MKAGPSLGTPQKSPKRFRISEAHNAVIAQGGGVKTVRKLFGVASDSASMRQFGLAVLRIQSAPRTTGPNCCLPPFAGGGGTVGLFQGFFYPCPEFPTFSACK